MNHPWKFCPGCGAADSNATDCGGNERCWHCGVCSFINCAESPSIHAEYEELAEAVLHFSTKPRVRWAHDSIVSLAGAHAEDSQTMDELEAEKVKA